MSIPRSSLTQRSKKQPQAPTHFFHSQQQWIGHDTTAPETPAHPPSHRNASSRRNSKEKENKGLPVGNKSPVEMMQDILRMVGEGQDNWTYYSREAEESLA